MTFIEVDTAHWHMPQQDAGTAAGLISGGIDSPVAAWLTMRSGIRLDLVHFHSYPFSCTSAIQKAKELSAKLLPLQGGGRLHLVPFLDLQEAVFRNTPNSLRIVIYRRAMARIAERIASVLGASFLVTGDSLGQVSSQTLQNLATVDQAVKMPILRPLIGFDKTEIIGAAKEIGTYEISIRPHEDCCTLFSLGNPATRTTAKQVEVQEGKMDMQTLIDRCTEAAETVPIGARED